MSRRYLGGWDRELWGVLFTGSRPDDQPMLLGEGWHEAAKNRPSAFPGEMSRALMFKTRVQARAYCAGEHALYAGRKDCCADWRFRPVKVRERVTVCPR